MFWEGRDALEHSEANDRYFGMSEPNEDEIPFEGSKQEQLGYEDGIDGIHVGNQGIEYEAGWKRGNAVRRLRDTPSR